MRRRHYLCKPVDVDQILTACAPYDRAKQSSRAAAPPAWRRGMETFNACSPIAAQYLPTAKLLVCTAARSSASSTVPARE